MREALVALGGGQCTVTCYQQDFGIQEFKVGEAAHQVPAPALICMQVQGYRELGELSDIWELRVTQPGPAGPLAANLYMRGTDIFMVSALSKVLR